MHARSIGWLPLAILLACGAEPAPAGAAPSTPARPAQAGPPAAGAAGALAVGVERLDASPACDGVVPEAVPAPLDVALEAGPGAECVATSDGTGAVALVCGEADRWTLGFFGFDGAARGTVTTGAVRSLEPRARGFQAVVAEAEDVRFLAIGSDGAVERNEPVAPPGLTLVDARLGPDPAGGGVVVARGTHVAGNHWFELLASRRDERAGATEAVRVANGSDPTSPMFFAGAASTAGAILVVWGERGAVHAAWLARDGSPLADPSDEGPTDALGLGVGTPVELAPLLDGSVALRAGAAWRRAWSPGASGRAPPDWLAASPATRVRHIHASSANDGHGSSAYALVPDPVATCAQRIELRNARGLLCGTVMVSTSASPCPTVRLDIGRDGTLLASPAVGTLRFWPALFR